MSLDMPPPKQGRHGLPPLTRGGTIGLPKRGGSPFFWMGEGTLQVPMSMHADNRARLCEALRARPEIDAGAVVFLQGGRELPVYDSDTNFGYRQESNFQYLFGVKEADCLAALRVRDARAVLFVPRLAMEYAKWMGPIKPPAWFHRAYGVDEVCHCDDKEVQEALERLEASELLVFKGVNRDSGLQLPVPEILNGLEKPCISDSGSKAMWDEMNECRLIKSSDELRIMQYVNDVSSEAHLETMRATRAGQREYLAEATFRYQAMLRGCFRTGYDCICPAGRRNAILHYGHAGEPNSESVLSGDLRLLDMGAEYHCYSADVTCTFPASGRFSEAQKVVYGAVWAAVLAVERQVKPGVCYKEMHRLAQSTLLHEMTLAGLFRGAVEDMMAAGVASYFMPHGLGHCLGLDVHDVGGYEPGVFRQDDPTIKENLRLGRKLKEGMVITVEPGFYFVDYLVEEALSTVPQFINEDRLRELWAEVGGVRIEDDVVIMAKGCRVLTCVPRSPEEIEAVMAGQPWTVGASSCREYIAGAL